MITEGSVKLEFDMPEKVSKELGVFYNPVMKLNRDISIEVLKIAGKDRPMRVALPLSGSGIRGLRFLKELPDTVRSVSFNDHADDFATSLKKRLVLNGIDADDDRVQISQSDANIFLLGSGGFDYIDIDPFGTPNPFLDAAVQRIARNGILAVTATDTSALAGTYADVCKRKYDAIPLRNWLKHVVGVRILIRKVQLVGAQYDKALYPVFSYAKDHYYRVFFRCVKSKDKCTEIVKSHQYLLYDKELFGYRYSQYSDLKENKLISGKMWSGLLWEQPYTQIDAIRWIPDEAAVDGYYLDLHMFCKKKGMKIPRFAVLSSIIADAGFNVSRTHFDLHAFKTDMPLEKLDEAILAAHSKTSAHDI